MQLVTMLEIGIGQSLDFAESIFSRFVSSARSDVTLYTRIIL